MPGLEPGLPDPQPGVIPIYYIPLFLRLVLVKKSFLPNLLLISPVLFLFYKTRDRRFLSQHHKNFARLPHCYKTPQSSYRESDQDTCLLIPQRPVTVFLHSATLSIVLWGWNREIRLQNSPRCKDLGIVLHS